MVVPTENHQKSHYHNADDFRKETSMATIFFSTHPAYAIVFS